MTKKKQGKTINPELEEKLKAETRPEPEPEPERKRNRRTKEEVQREKIEKAKAILANNQSMGEVSETGKEFYQGIGFGIFGVKEKDLKDFPEIEPDKLEDFEEFGKATAKMINYYTKGVMSEGQLLIFSFAMSTVPLITNRMRKVNQIRRTAKKEEPIQHGTARN